MRTTIGLLSILAVLSLMLTGPTACETEDECLVAQENCTRDYVAQEYGDDRICCDGMSCEEGTISGVLICR